MLCHTMKHVLLLCALAALSAACASRETASDAPAGGGAAPAARALAGTEWRLVEVGGRAAIAGLGERVAFLRFDGPASSVHGSSGLNTFFGPYAQDGARLRVENLALTRMAGPPELMAQEQAFTAAIQAARAFRVAGEELALLDPDGALLARLRAHDG
jgi:heat shock protein HslJ